jgi:hypothetical protein
MEDVIATFELGLSTVLDKSFYTDYEGTLHFHLNKITSETEAKLNKITDIENDDDRSHEIHNLLEVMSGHVSAFLASVGFGVMTDPENWIKHTFYESLKHVQHYRKDAIDAIVKSGQENTTEH